MDSSCVMLILTSSLCYYCVATIFVYGYKSKVFFTFGKIPPTVSKEIFVVRVSLAYLAYGSNPYNNRLYAVLAGKKRSH
jgi:hypothetical protein